MAAQEEKRTEQGDVMTSTTPVTRRDKRDSDYDGIHSGINHSANETHANKSTTGLYSEHGHSISRIRPMAQHSGCSVASFFNGLFTTIIGIATLGASITFSYVLSNNTSIAPSPNPTFNVRQVQQFLAISWLLFLLALGFASLGSSLLTFFKGHWIADWDGMNGRISQWSVQMYAVCTSGLLGGLTIGAFALLCLVVVPYSAVVGWIALGFTAFFGVIVLVAVINQAPWPWRGNTPPSPTRHHTA
ncbi:uncharacterized protein Z518_02562 [Rhinocladiella mackenziei CBS 650.93]|uniref:Rhinocladiella mackenziei CBS 650.93 unplaced genomic scaffold supercont1.2, whole genome shotgun sequence n=1 Tax=Rhinocladiella mackenziei CBS 650.93 TaxID=1442369 RepID=A0A0D2HBT7_9EURO|nr:uncharacterized protein Z518_02562 [Rhinocladiella mackenziei CBS 650.93]KIX07908.1 hypothetical protein Z518_02562 [Rhinocladiella mackenziei CBS 650.93]